ncbi:hypothetical protein [Cerasicoccus frondis]|uniref:hypothetical protein n=1 Tax=Cerasicoccus frondis TaxID=490090 RepID=UPI002852CF89|nr:hypothetical protein [Cerasicoccus frondis]
MKEVTFIEKKVVPIADCDGQPIRLGDVLRCIDEGSKDVGVVFGIVNKDDKSSYGRHAVGPIAHGDLILRTSHCSTRVTNRYAQWKHVERNDQTYWQRRQSWLAKPFQFDEYGPSNTELEQYAIEAIMALLPEDTVNYEYDSGPNNVDDAIYYLAEHLGELKGETSQ